MLELGFVALGALFVGGAIGAARHRAPKRLIIVLLVAAGLALVVALLEVKPPG
jgi:hypothetical protein